MAALGGFVSLNHVGVAPDHTTSNDHKDLKQFQAPNNDNLDYSQRGQWLRAAVLGASDGLVSIASLLMGVGAVNRDVRAMLLSGFAGLVAGACSMAIGEFVSVYTQYEIEMAQLKRQKNMISFKRGDKEVEIEKLPNLVQAAFASAIAFSIGAVVPLLSAVFITDHRVRLVVVVAVASLALLVFGAVGAMLGKTPVGSSCARVMVGGWMAMAITYGLTKLLGSSGMEF